MRSPVSWRGQGECNAIRSREFGHSELTFVAILQSDSGASQKPVSGQLRCGVQILFLLLACCTDWQNLGGYVAWIHHLTHCWHELIARR